MTKNSVIQGSPKKKILVVSAAIYIMALLILIGMYFRTSQAIQFYNSYIYDYSQPLPAYSTDIESPEGKSRLLSEQIKEMAGILIRKPSNLEIDNELVGLTKKHRLEIISLSTRGTSKQTIINPEDKEQSSQKSLSNKGKNKQSIVKGSYSVQSFNLLVAGLKQDVINMLGDLQSFGPGLLIIDSLNMNTRGESLLIDISFAVYSREAIPDIVAQLVKEEETTASSREAKKTSESQ